MSNTAVMAFGEETTSKVAAMIASKLNADLIVNEKCLTVRQLLSQELTCVWVNLTNVISVL